MIYSKQIDDIEIQVYSRKESSLIPEKQWNELARSSLYTNPFYERWNLLPALKYLDKSDDVYLVAISRKGDLIGLFPIIINNSFFGLKTLSLWQHDHCYLTDPLTSIDIDLLTILHCLGSFFHTQWSQIDSHSPSLLSGYSKQSIHSINSNRAAVLHPINILNKLSNLPRKIQRDIKRTSKNLEKQYAISFSNSHNLADSFERYIKLEHKGWKGQDKGSIISSQNTLDYYYHMIKTNPCHQSIRIQELIADNTSIAICIRFISGNKFYEVKTSFDESYKQYSPGRLLEINNLEELSNINFSLVDSCTGENNKLINKLWPDRINLQSSYIFYPTLTSQILMLFHTLKRIKQKIKVFRYASN